MSALLQLLDINYSHSHQSLFERLNLTINQGDKIGLVGHNGCGKSTLLSLISGDKAIDEGEIRRPKHVNIAFVEQFVPAELAQLPLIDAVMLHFSEDERLSNQWQAESQLQAIGFAEHQFDIKVKDLSGGQQNLLLIAKALIQQPDLLLMDEPGNHMDIAAMTRLEQFLNNECPCGFLIISHDQHLLDNVCQKTVFMRDKRCYSFELPFSEAEQKLAEEDEAAQKRLNLEEKEIKRLQQAAKRFAIWGREHDNEKFARKAKHFEKRVQKLEENKTEVSQGSGLNLALKNHNLGAKQLLAIDDCDIFTADGARQLLHIEQLVIRPGERVALLGINGVGKSSTLETIRKVYQSDNASDGNIRFNPRTELGYYDQELGSLTVNKTRLDWLRDATNATEDDLKYALIGAGIDYKDFDRKVNELSGGERARMMFIAFALNQPNFMILDEPTNHIDLAGKAQLTEELIDSGATLFITSHDRYFLQQVATRWLWIVDGKLTEVNSSDDFYQSLLSGNDVSVTSSIQVSQKPTKNHSSETAQAVDEEAILQRIDQLETLIAEDTARKAKFQKPQLQQQWQQELDQLWLKIDSA